MICSVHVFTACLLEDHMHTYVHACIHTVSSTQALFDLVSFQQYIHAKYKLPERTKWVLFGGSYPGKCYMHTCK